MTDDEPEIGYNHPTTQPEDDKMTDYFNHLQNEYFDKLYKHETNTPAYCLVQGDLIAELGSTIGKQDHRVGDTDAIHVAQLLNRGKVEEAENLTEELLE